MTAGGKGMTKGGEPKAKGERPGEERRETVDLAGKDRAGQPMLLLDYQLCVGSRGGRAGQVGGEVK